MKNAAAISAQLVDIRNLGHNKSVKLTLHLPAEQAGMVMDAFGWPTLVDPVPVALARLVQPAERQVVPANANAKPPDTQPASVKPPVRAPRITLAQRAGILSKDLLFHRYVEATTINTGIVEEDAAEFIRGRCHVGSRSHITTDSVAGTLFSELLDDFMKWRNADAYVETT